MKKQILSVMGFISMSFGIYAQQNPTNNSPGGTILSGQTSNQYWSRAGNNQILGSNNIFGTLWNSPIYTQTNAINRMKLNGNLNYTVDGYNVARNGNLLIGWQNTGSLYTTKGAYSLLHINGQGTIVQEAGHRPWMQAGATFTGNNDLGYVGLRQVGTGTDVTEMTLSWADNGIGNIGPDDMAFRFLGPGAGNTTISNNLQTNNDLDGLHIARFTPTGEFGLGNTFGTNAPGTPANLYVRPQSLMHLSLDNNREVWAQFTNQTVGQTQTDGLRFGIAPTGNAVNGYLRWQENAPFIVQTASSASGASASNGERMRITSIGSLNATQGNFGGLTTPINRTRVAISADGANPITKPLSLLHLGYNTGAVAITPGTDGWRNWMDIGIFSTNGTDHVYLGLKDENGLLGDRQDAVLNWGDNQVSGLPPGNGPDNFRMIFTSTTAATGGGTAPANTNDGLEGLRMTPTPANGIFTGIGGDPSANHYYNNSINPTINLEVNSWGNVNAPGGSSGMRFTDLNTSSPTLPNPGMGVLAVDSTGKVIYVQGGGGSSANIGNYCSAQANPLTGNYQIPLAGYTMNYTENALTPSQFNIGYSNCSPALLGRFNTYNDTLLTAGFFHSERNNANLSIGMAGLSENTSGNAIGIYGRASSASNSNNNYVIGVEGEATDSVNRAERHHGLNAIAANGTWQSFAVNADVMNSSSPNNYGYQTEIYNSTSTSFNYGVDAVVLTQASTNYGVRVFTAGATNDNYGLYSRCLPSATATNFAGYFIGNVHVNGDVTYTGSATQVSDALFKNNVDTIANSLDIIEQLHPKSFYFDTANVYGMHFNDKKQYGFIAQDVEQVLPDLVETNTKPAEYDSIGNIIVNEVSYKTLNYNAFIGILTDALQRQQQQITQRDSVLQEVQHQLASKDTIIADLNDRLTSLESCLSGILPFLCQLNQSTVQSTPEVIQAKLLNEIDITLKDRTNIILNQNVPNPFRERTTIRYVIPQTVKNAQIIFYDMQGKIMNTVDVLDRGEGRINVYSDDLSSGIYIYTLICDGQVIATKKMLKE